MLKLMGAKLNSLSILWTKKALWQGAFKLKVIGAKLNSHSNLFSVIGRIYARIVGAKLNGRSSYCYGWNILRIGKA